MQVFYQPLLPDVKHLPEEEAKHCLRVLRHQTGEIIHLTDGRGNLYKARLKEEPSKKASFELLECIKEREERDYHIHIAIAPTKSSDRLEWFIEKAMEFGIDEISLLQCRNSERVKLNLDRLQKKAISAIKQSLNLEMPIINELKKFPQFVTEWTGSGKEGFIAYVDKEIPLHLKDLTGAGKEVCVLIGPEGDFAPDEITMALKSGFQPVSLGKSRLRTETAGMAACHILNLINE